MEQFEYGDFATRSGDPALQAAWRYDHEVRPRTENRWNYCALCGDMHPLQLMEGANPDSPDMREDVACSHCGLSARIRASLALLRRNLPAAGGHVYATEQTTRTFVWMQENLVGQVSGSEYEPDAEKRALLGERLAAIGGSGEVDFNDITASHFGDAELDAILSLDVLEHVPDYGKALAECARTLRRGGVLVATFPFADCEETIVRARLDASGEIEHLLEPEFHGDPIGSGVLCWYHFGWDILAVCRRAGFADARMVMPWNPAEGFHFGLWTLIATR